MEKVLVVCPGRDSYTEETMGYLKPFYSGEVLGFIDKERKKLGKPMLCELDSLPFKSYIHTRGEHACPLVYAGSCADFLTLKESYKVIALAGNSMGWYTALFLAKSLDKEVAFLLVQTMGESLLIGKQVICPLVDENWCLDVTRRQMVFRAIKEVNQQSGGWAGVSIHLGGNVVVGVNVVGVDFLLERLPQQGVYPSYLVNHGAFHTPLLKEASERAFKLFPEKVFYPPEIPIVDGRGKIWTPYCTDTKALREYTLGTQVVEPYHFTRSIEVALKEFAPDRVILLGPGNFLGGVLGQIMVDIHWRGLSSKQDFTHQQSQHLISMGLQ